MVNFPETLARSRFYLELKLDGSQEPVDGSFMECSGFKVTQEIVEATEVTPQQWGKAKHGLVVRTKIPGNVKYTNIVLRRGLTCSMTLWNWLQAVQAGEWGAKKKAGSLTIYDQGATQQFRLEFKNAWPVSYTIGDLSVISGDLEIEELEVTVEELKRVRV